MSHHFGWKYWGEAIDPHRSQARESAERAVTLDPEGADARWIRGYVRTYDGKLAEGIADFETALRINPNHADAWALLTDLRVLEGRPLDAIDCANTAFRLNPYPPGVYYWVLGWAQYAAGHIEDAAVTLRNDAARGTGSQRLLAASLANSDVSTKRSMRPNNSLLPIHISPHRAGRAHSPSCGRPTFNTLWMAISKPDFPCDCIDPASHFLLAACKGASPGRRFSSVPSSLIASRPCS